MSIVPDIQAQEDVIFPPRDLCSDEPPLESYLHLQQLMLLLNCLDSLWRDRNDFFSAGNLTIYYSQRQRKSEKYRGPDFFVVLNTERKPRNSWVVWEEDNKYPSIIVELLSDSTAKVDKGVKKEIYQNIFQTPDYFWFDPNDLEFAGFHLINGIYQPIQPNSQGWLWSQQLNLYLGVYQRKLRFFQPDGELVPTDQEKSDKQTQLAEREAQRAEQEKTRADNLAAELEQEKQRAQQQKQRADNLAAKLRELSQEPGNW
jgi:Uma2 family endonuclease